MRVEKITPVFILFDDGSTITYGPDNFGWSYADFGQLEDTGVEEEEFSSPLIFEEVRGSGFRFGNPGKMFFVPCYAFQSGAYKADVNIYLNQELKLSLFGEWLSGC